MSKKGGRGKHSEKRKASSYLFIGMAAVMYECMRDGGINWHFLSFFSSLLPSTIHSYEGERERLSGSADEWQPGTMSMLLKRAVGFENICRISVHCTVVSVTVLIIVMPNKNFCKINDTLPRILEA